jgi:hypothetical protein
VLGDRGQFIDIDSEMFELEVDDREPLGQIEGRDGVSIKE